MQNLQCLLCLVFDAFTFRIIIYRCPKHYIRFSRILHGLTSAKLPWCAKLGGSWELFLCRDTDWHNCCHGLQFSPCFIFFFSGSRRSHSMEGLSRLDEDDPGQLPWFHQDKQVSHMVIHTYFFPFFPWFQYQSFTVLYTHQECYGWGIPGRPAVLQQVKL